MIRNDPSTGAENIVQLPHLRRKPVVPPRSQAAPIVPFQSWVEVRDRAAAALLGGTRRMLLTGPAGTGKTVLIDHTARVLRAAGRTVVIQLADIDPAPPPAGTTLFVDEADRLDDAKLRALNEAPGSVVLAGLDVVARRMPSATMHLVLKPLGQAAARAYVATWLDQTGRVPADIDSMAVRRLIEVSGGVPRLLSTLLAAAAWLASTGDVAVIGVAQVQEAAELRSVLGAPAAASVAEPTRRGRAVASALLAAGVFIATAVAVAPRLFPVTSQFGDRVGVAAAEALSWVRTELGRPAPRRNVGAFQPAVVTVPVLAPVLAPAQAPVPAPIALPPEAVPVPVAPPADAPTAQALAPEVLPPQVSPVETVDVLLRRGREMLQMHDLSAARLLFRRAADAGSSKGMFELGQTFDPAFLVGIGAGDRADTEQAMHWYANAAAAGIMRRFRPK